MDSFKPHKRSDFTIPNNPDNISILYLKKKTQKTLPSTLTFYKVIFLKLLALSMKIRGRGSSKKIWNANPVWVIMGWNKFWLRILILSLFLCIFTIYTITVLSRNTSCLVRGLIWKHSKNEDFLNGSTFKQKSLFRGRSPLQTSQKTKIYTLYILI